jgi:hypothetical protein
MIVTAIISPRLLKREIFHRYLACFDLPDQLVTIKKSYCSRETNNYCSPATGHPMGSSLFTALPDSDKLTDSPLDSGAHQVFSKPLPRA